MIVPATKYADVRKMAGARRSPDQRRTSALPRRRSVSSPGAPAVFVPKREAMVSWPEWFWRELKEGGRLHEYIRREKATSKDRLRAVARRQDRWKQNFKSEHQLLAAIPAREYHRWKAVDPHFWEDDANLRSFRRDNPDAKVYI